MSDRTKGKARAAREQRLSAAMRENLKRRKAQARGRATPEPKRDKASSRGPGSGKGA